MKEKKEKREPFYTLDDFVSEGENKYQVIVEIAANIKRQFELSGERDDSLIMRVLEEFKKKKDEKDSLRSDG
jgi:hypothetical protein